MARRKTKADAEEVEETTTEPDAESVVEADAETDAEEVEETTTEPDAESAPDVESDLAAFVGRVFAHLPQRFTDDMVAHLESRGIVRTDDIRALPNNRALHLLTSGVNAILRKHALDLHAFAFKQPVGDPGQHSLYGLDLRALYPDCSPPFVNSVRRNLQIEQITGLRELAERWAYAHCIPALRRVIRHEDTGMDGYTFLAALNEES